MNNKHFFIASVDECSQVKEGETWTLLPLWDDNNPGRFNGDNDLMTDAL